MKKLNKNLSADEFDRHYFLKEQLVTFCREEGLKVTGNKSELEDRIRYYLSTGKKLNNSKTSNKKPHQNISLNSKIGKNFVCSQEVRQFFISHLGSGFKFKVSFQKWLKDNPDKTFADALIAYQEIMIDLKDNPTIIGKQFQYNQYIRDFFNSNPQKSLEDAIKCWNYKKNIPGSCKYEDVDLKILK